MSPWRERNPGAVTDSADGASGSRAAVVPGRSARPRTRRRAIGRWPLGRHGSHTCEHHWHSAAQQHNGRESPPRVGRTDRANLWAVGGAAPHVTSPAISSVSAYLRCWTVMCTEAALSPRLTIRDPGLTLSCPAYPTRRIHRDRQQRRRNRVGEARLLPASLGRKCSGSVSSSGS